LLDDQGRFLTMASPTEIRRASTKAAPKLEVAYLQTREQAPSVSWFAGEVDRIIFGYRAALSDGFGHAENDVKQVVTPAGIRELGIRPDGQELLRFGTEAGETLCSDIMRRRTPYVCVMRQGNLESIVDRAELASRIANTTFR
jgi:hypothetical protein